MHYCTVEKFFVAVGSGDLNRIKALNFGPDHLTSRLTMSRPQLTVDILNATVFHLATQLGHVHVLIFLGEQLKLFEEKRLQELEVKFGRWAEMERPKSLFHCLNYSERFGTTPLIVAIGATHPHQFACVKTLLDLGADINREQHAPGSNQDYDYTPLCCAVMAMREDIITLLLERGADPNKKIGYKGTVLNFAIDLIPKDPNFAYRIIDLLLFWGADPTIYSEPPDRVYPLKNRLTRKIAEIYANDEDAEFLATDDVFGIVEENSALRPENCLNPKEFLMKEKKTDYEYDDELDIKIETEFTEDVIYRRRGKTAIDYAITQQLPDLAEKMQAYANATKAALQLLKYARDFLNRPSDLSILLPRDLIKLALFYLSNAFNNLTYVQSTQILAFAADKTTLGTSQLDFLKRNVFQFFRDGLPKAESFLTKKQILIDFAPKRKTPKK